MFRNKLKFLLALLTFVSVGDLSAQTAPKDSTKKEPQKICFTSEFPTQPDTARSTRMVVRDAPPCGGVVDTTKKVSAQPAGPRANPPRITPLRSQAQTASTTPQRVEVALSTDTLVVKNEVNISRSDTITVQLQRSDFVLPTTNVVSRESFYSRHEKAIKVVAVTGALVGGYCIISGDCRLFRMTQTVTIGAR